MNISGFAGHQVWLPFPLRRKPADNMHVNGHGNVPRKLYKTKLWQDPTPPPRRWEFAAPSFEKRDISPCLRQGPADFCLLPSIFLLFLVLQISEVLSDLLGN